MENIYARIIEEIAAIKKVDENAVSLVYKSIKKNVNSLSEKDSKDVLTVWMFEKYLREYVVPIRMFENKVEELKKQL